jgi:glycoprotein endo-alpha-1,2-mannosidase
MIMAAAPTHGMKVSAYYEQVPNLGPGALPGATADAVVADIEYLLDNYANRPGWLSVEGRPVIFLFRRSVVQLGVDGWWAVGRALARRRPRPLLIGDVDLDGPVSTIPTTFGGVHVYNNSDLTVGKAPEMLRAWAANAYPRWTAKWRSTLTCLTIMPGFGNARATGSPISYQITERFGGDTYSILGEAAVRANPDWLLITSWNEWHEGTEIEPSLDDGDRALQQTARIAQAFRAMPGRRLRLR